jgi:hypothetical protein
MRSPRAMCRSGLATLALAAFAACGQPVFEQKDPVNAPVSRWQDQLDRIDGEVRLALLSASDPRAHYVAARLERLDLEAAVRHFAQARIAAPQERLYLASLATACLQPVQPALPECDAVDRLADWARRDADNGLPQLWLAERARKRNDKEAMVAYVEQAAAASRFDDYASRGTLEVWEYFQSLPMGYDAAAKAEAALGYAAAQPLGAVSDAALRTCIQPAERAEPLRVACAKLGATMVDRGASMSARRSGTWILERNAADAASRERAVQQRAQLVVQDGRCGELTPIGGLESADPGVRARAIAAADNWVRTLAQYGEVAGCERLLARAKR